MIWRMHYRSMYEGSMVGAGAVVFAVMGYIIAHQERDRRTGFWVVRLHPSVLSTVIGEDEEVIEGAILKLCAEDKKSSSPVDGGRRLVQLGEGSVEYRVVNGEKYQKIRDYEIRKEQNREAQATHREKKKGMKASPPHGPTPRETAACAAAKRDDWQTFDKLSEPEERVQNPK
jgi:hypothetical protein